MKRRLNILCLTVMLVLSYSVFESAYTLSVAFMDGYRLGNDQSKRKDIAQTVDMKMVAVLPNNFAAMTDSVYNEKSGTYVPVLYDRLTISLKTPSSATTMMPFLFCSIFELATLIGAIVWFLRLIVAINHSRIFCWKNVRRLRLIGVMLVVSFMTSVVPICVTAHELSESLLLPNYTLAPSQLVYTLTLVLGLVSLIVGEVFAIGLRLQEEQELTI